MMKNSIEELQLFESLLRTLARRAPGRTRANAVLLLAALEALEALNPHWRAVLIDRLDQLRFSLTDGVFARIPVKVPIPDGLVESVTMDVMAQLSPANKMTESTAVFNTDFQTLVAAAVPTSAIEEAAARLAIGFEDRRFELTLADAAVVLMTATKDYPWVAIRHVRHAVRARGFDLPPEANVGVYLAALTVEYMAAQFCTIMADLSGE